MMKAKPAKWTAEMDNRLRDLYPKLLNSDIAAHFNLTKHQIEYRAEYIGLKKPPWFKQQHMQESCAKRNLNTARARASKGRFRKGHSIGMDHRYTTGHHLTPEEDAARIRHITESRRKQTYEELLRIKYGLRRQTKLQLPDKVYNIDKKKYFPDNDSD